MILSQLFARFLSLWLVLFGTPTAALSLNVHDTGE